MSKITKTFLTLALFLVSSSGLRAQWSPISSGTSDSLRGVALLDSGLGFAVGDGGTILKTSDAGLTWNALVSGTTKNLYDVALLNENESIAVGDSGLILRTSDGGATWLAVASGVRDGLRSISFSGANGICGGLSQDILYSSDSGATWHVAQKGFFGGGFFGAHMLSPTVGFVSGQNSIFQGFLGTTVDGGVHWSFHPFYFNGNEGSCDDLFFFDNLTGVTSGVLFDGTGAIARTTNAGSSFNSILFPQGMQGIDFPKPEAGFAVGFVGTILKSTDLGVTWWPQNSGSFFDLYDVHFASDGLTGVAVGASGTILRTADGGEEVGLELLAAASHKGRFDLDLPLNGPPGIECRSGGTDGHYNIVFTFSSPISSVESITVSCGNVSGSQIDDLDPHRVLVSLTGATCNGEEITVAASGVHDDQGHSLAAASVDIGLLLGDINGDAVVDSTDAHQVKVDRGQDASSVNFREDVSVTGRIDSVDFAIVKSQLGTMLAP